MLPSVRLDGGGGVGETSDCEEGILPSEALACCIRLSSFFSAPHYSDEVAKKLTVVADYVRKKYALGKTQVRIDSFFDKVSF